MPSIAFPPDDTTSSPFAPSQTNDGGLRTKDPARATRNRLNAARSTGPRTPAGKARSAQNARTHNLTAATPPPNLLADPTYRQAKQELVEELRPTTPMQQVLVSQLAHLTWQLDQVPKLEHQVLAAAAPDAPLQDSALSTPDLHNRLTALHLLQNTPTPLTRLWDHHRRLLTRTQSLLRQLLHLQRHQHDPPGPDAAPESPRARRQRADDRAALDAELRRIHHDNQRKADQARRAPTASEISNLKSDPPTPTPQITPNPANARQTTPSTTPAQNEPTPLPSPRSVSSVSSVVNLLPATQQSATPRNAAQQNPPPAQNEPTGSPSSSSPSFSSSLQPPAERDRHCPTLLKSRGAARQSLPQDGIMPGLQPARPLKRKDEGWNR